MEEWFNGLALPRTREIMLSVVLIAFPESRRSFAYAVLEANIKYL
jgi:hypothetical protein